MAATLTLSGRLTHPPRLTYADSGRAVATFTLAENRRTRQDDGTWTDGVATFWRCSTFGKQAEHLAESDLRPGDPLTVTGRPEGRTWTGRDGTERTAVELTADVVAVGLARGPVTLDRGADRGPTPGPTESGRRDPGARLDRWQDDAPPF
jgi:single-strand DNA-binding protein